MTQGAPTEGLQAMPARRRPWWSRMSGPQLLMVVVGVLAFLANLVVLRGQDDVALLAVAQVDLNPGLVLDSSQHLEFVEVEASSPLLARGISRDGADTVDGQIVTARISQGDMVNRSQLRDAAASDDFRAMSFPIDASNAAGGQISIGDRVDVIAVDDGVARYVLVGAEVIDRSAQASGGITGSRSFYLVVAVDADQALALASALDTDQIQVVRSTGATSPGILEFDPRGGTLVGGVEP